MLIEPLGSLGYFELSEEKARPCPKKTNELLSTDGKCIGRK